MPNNDQVENTSRASDKKLEKRGGYQPHVPQGSQRPIPPQGGAQSYSNNNNR